MHRQCIFRLGIQNMMKLGILKGTLAGIVRCGTLLLLILAAARPGSAQNASPSSAPTPNSSATPSTGVVTSEVKSPAVTLATPGHEPGSPHLLAKTGPPAEEANRRNLEENAGRDPANILLRSSPAGAQIYINGAFVGHTPLLLSVAPGKYKVEMRGQRDDFAVRTIGLMARDTQEITLMLSTRYPSRVSTH
jgi:PEGA domain-containing protein